MPYKNKNSPEALKSLKKADWKRQGIIFIGLEDEIYDIYINQDTCDKCKRSFKNSRDRCLDHDHLIKDDFNVRNILCQNCHLNLTKQKWNTNTGLQFIGKTKCSLYKLGYCFQIQIRRYGKTVLAKRRKTLEEAIVVRDEFIKKNPEYFK